MRRGISRKNFLITFSILVVAILIAYSTAVGFRVNDNNFFVSPSNGNVGIGTSTPTEKLDVVGTVKATRFCIGTNCITTWPSGTSNPGSSPWATSGNNIYFNGGKVGIGTNSPPHLLSLAGPNAVLYINRTGNEPAIVLAGPNGGVQIRGISQIDTNGGIRITDSDAVDEWMRIIDLGNQVNVYIGTTSSALLKVGGIALEGWTENSGSLCGEGEWGTIARCTNTQSGNMLICACTKTSSENILTWKPIA